jgi:hypothetical protein
MEESQDLLSCKVIDPFLKEALLLIGIRGPVILLDGKSPFFKPRMKARPL